MKYGLILGLGRWKLVTKFDRRAVAIADEHYSRRKPGSPQFMPPGETIVLLSTDARAVFGWWRPHPNSGIRAMNGLDAWTCCIFRRQPDAAELASVLVLAAERALLDLDVSCGPDGLITYVWPAKVRSRNPGCCFKKAGWKRSEKNGGRSADGRKVLLEKPFALAGIPR